MSGHARVAPGCFSGSSALGLGLAPAFIGTIEVIVGSAKLSRPDGVAELKLGDLVRQGDLIETNADGQVNIRFVDGTVLRLSSNTSLVLKRFVADEAAPSASLGVTRGAFAFVAGEMAKRGRLSIDTPIATLRGRTGTGGFGMLSTAALYFAIMDKAQASGPNAVLFDDGVIDYKDLAHGVFDVVTKEAIPRRFVVDDPGKTVVLHRLGSSISADVVTHTPTQMAQLQAAQKDALQTFSLGLQQGPTSTGPGGSSTPPAFLAPIPINYAPPPPFSPAPSLNSGANNGAGGGNQSPAPPPPVYIPPPPPVITNAVFFTSPSGGNWQDPTNWSTGAVPSPSQDIVINLPSISGSIFSTLSVSLGSALLISTNATLNFAPNGTQTQLTVAGLFDSTGTSSIINATVVITSTGTLESTGGTLTIDPSTINNAGTLKADGATLDLKDIVTFINTGLLLSTNIGLLVLEGDTVANAGGTVKIDYGSTLDLETTTITGGTLIIGGVLNSTGPNSISGASIDVAANGVLESTSGALTLDPSAIMNAGTITAAGGELDLISLTPFTNTGTLLATNNSLLVLNSDTIGNLGGTIEVDSGSTIALINDIITGGTITDGGLIDVTGSSKIAGSSGPAVDAALNGGAVTVESGQTLTLDNVTVTGTSFTDSGSIKVEAGQKLTLKGSDSITGGQFTNQGTVDVAAGTTTLASDAFTNTGALLTVEGTLALNGTTITGGTITDGGLIDVTGSSKITGSSGPAVDAALNGGAVTVESGQTLTLDNVTVTGTSFTDSGSIKVEAGQKLTLKGSDSITGGLVTNQGTVDVAAGTTTLASDAFTNTGALLTVEGTLALNGTTLTGGGTLTNAGTVEVTGGTTSKLDGVTVKNGGSGAGVLALDGNAFVNTPNNVNFASVFLTTSNANDVVILYSVQNFTTVSSVSDQAGLVWHQRAVAGAAPYTIYEYYAIAPNALSGDAITVNFASSAFYADVNAFAISGANTLSPFDGNVSVPVTVNASTGSITTSNANDFIIAGYRFASNFAPDAGLGWTAINASGGYYLSEYQIVSGTQTNLVASASSPDENGGIVDAIQAAVTGTVTVDAGSTLDLNNTTITGGGTANLGTINVSGIVDITGNISGTGSINILNNAQLEIGGTVAVGQTVSLQGVQGTLILDHSKNFHGIIAGLIENSTESLENQVDLKDLPFTTHMAVVSRSYHMTTNTTDVTFGDGISANNITLTLSGNYSASSGTDFEFAKDSTGGTLIDDPLASSGVVTIDSDRALDIAAASTATVRFTNSNGATGELVLENSKDFSGQIVGFAGYGASSNSDLINLADIYFADIALDKTVYVDNGDGTGTLTLKNTQDQALDSLTFVGSYQLANFTVENDGSGHALIFEQSILNNTNTMIVSDGETLLT
jgi:hypothetical protein